MHNMVASGSTLAILIMSILLYDTATSFTSGEGYLVVAKRWMTPITVGCASKHTGGCRRLNQHKRSTGNDNLNRIVPSELESSGRAFDFRRKLRPAKNTERRNINLNILSNINLGDIIRTYQGRPNATEDEKDIPRPIQGRRFFPFRWF